MDDKIIIDCIEKGIIWAGWSTEQKVIMQEAINRIRELQYYKQTGITPAEVAEYAKAKLKDGR